MGWHLAGPFFIVEQPDIKHKQTYTMDLISPDLGLIIWQTLGFAILFFSSGKVCLGSPYLLRSKKGMGP